MKQHNSTKVLNSGNCSSSERFNVKSVSKNFSVFCVNYTKNFDYYCYYLNYVI